MLDENNLKLAYMQVYQNKGAPGVDKVTVEELEEYMVENMTRIKDEIRKRKYTPSPVKRVYIPKDNGDRRGLNFARYADDCIIVVKSEKTANRIMESITEYIEKKLGLKVNVTKSKVAKPKDIKYLGFGFYTNTKGIIRPKPHIKSMQKFQRKVKQLTKRNWSISLDERIKKINYVTRGWINYFKIADMKGFLEEVGEKLRYRIRTIIWKQWKIPKIRYRALVKLGISEEQAKIVACTRRGYFWVTSTVVLQIARSNKRLKQRGLVFSLDHYDQVHI